jgi:predicted TIM-barrel fold metal-dependent hydrolase
MIVDIHVHLPNEVRAGQTLDELLPATERMIAFGRRAGITKQVLLGMTPTVAANELLGRLAQRFGEELIPFVRGSFVDPDGPALLERCVKELGFKGLKLYGEPPYFPLSGLLGGHALFSKAGELGVPVLLHSWHIEEGLERLAGDINVTAFPTVLLRGLGERHRHTSFIIAHAGGMWVKAFQAARPYPNIYFDVSGFDPERGIIEKAVEVLGADRVLYGSDAPGRSYVAQLAKVRYADISEAERAMILGQNAARLLNIDDAGQ